MTKEEFWVHAVTDALQGLLAGRSETEPEGPDAYVDLAAEMADRLTEQWQKRFREKE